MTLQTGKAENVGWRKKEVENNQDAFYTFMNFIKNKSLKIRKLHGINKIKFLHMACIVGTAAILVSTAST